MIKNGQKTLPHILKQLDEAACLSQNTNFLFFESNSKDDTPQILDKWKNTKMNETFCANIMNQHESNMTKPNVLKHEIFGNEYAERGINHQIKLQKSVKLSRVQRPVA